MEIQTIEVYELPDVPREGPCGVRKASKGRVKRGGKGAETDVSSRAENIPHLPIDMKSATGGADISVWETEMINSPLNFV